MATVQKFLQHIDLNYDWFAGHGDQRIGHQRRQPKRHVRLPAILQLADAAVGHAGLRDPLLGGAGFRLGDAAPLRPAATTDMPPQTYDAYLDAAWNPKVTACFGGELNARVGVYCDFYSVDSDSLRFTGKGLAVVKFSPQHEVEGGRVVSRSRERQDAARRRIGLDAQPRRLFSTSSFPTREWPGGSRPGATPSGGSTAAATMAAACGPSDESPTITTTAFLPIPMQQRSHWSTTTTFAWPWAGVQDASPAERLFRGGLGLRPPVELRKRPAPAFYPNNTVFIGAGLSY